MKLLHIDSSILGGNSVSRTLSAATVARLQAGRDDVIVAYRDVAAEPIPHLSGAYLGALQSTEPQHTPELQGDLAISATVLEEFLDADTIVIGVAFYNFTIASQLKAWIDRILVAGRTFRYTAEGKVEGLATGKRVILTIARGGIYSAGSPIASFEHAENYLRTAFGFIGLNVEVVVAEGLAIGPDQRAAAIEQAQAKITALAA